MCRRSTATKALAFEPEPRAGSRSTVAAGCHSRHGAGDRFDPTPHPGAAGCRWRTDRPCSRRRLHPRQIIARVRDRDGHMHMLLKLYHRWPVRSRAALPAPRSCRRAADHRATHPRHLLPVGEGRQGGGARTVRRRQDRGAAADRALVERRHRDLRRLRRARQRAGGYSGNLPRTHRSQHRPSADGTHAVGGQHLQYAGGGARSIGLHRRDARRIFPRSGLRRGDGGRFHQSLGRGAARSGGPPRADAGGRRLSRLSRLAPAGVLRARRTRQDARPARAARSR